MPVTVEIVVEFLEIIQRRLRGGLHIASAVIPPVGFRPYNRPVPGMNCHRPTARARE